MNNITIPKDAKKNKRETISFNVSSEVVKLFKSFVKSNSLKNNSVGFSVLVNSMLKNNS